MNSNGRERCFTCKQMRLSDISYCDPSMVYFATLCARDRGPVFENERLAKLVVESLLWRSKNDIFRLYCYCLMPDHLHIAASPLAGEESLSEKLGQFKSFTTKQSWQLGYSGQLWQRSWYDHVARRDEDVLAICDYIMANPVRKGLVESIDEWPYSGFCDSLPL